MKINVLWLGIILLLVPFVSAVSLTATMEEGESKTFTLNEIGYYVDILIIEDVSPPTVTFRINGELIGQLQQNELAFLNTGTKVYIDDITLNEAGEAGSGDTVTFTLDQSSGESDYIEIQDVDVKINDFAIQAVDDGDSIEQLHPGDQLDFKMEIENHLSAYPPEFTQGNLYNITISFTCDTKEAPSQTTFIPLISADDSADAFITTTIAQNASEGTADCSITAEGIDEFNIVRKNKIKFDMEIEEGPGIGKEVCSDGIDNDFDGQADCEDLLECGGYCINQVQEQNKQLTAQVEQLQRDVKQTESTLAELQQLVRRVVCAVFGCS